MESFASIREESLKEKDTFTPFGKVGENGKSRLKGGSTDDFNFGASHAERFSNMIPFEPTTELTDIHFKFDKYDLDDAAKELLKRNAVWLKSHPEVKIQIQGHSDERGTNNYNLGLGERRALSAKKYLMALGIEKDRLFTVSYGEEKPFCVQSNENCWWQNRRGHFLVSKTRGDQTA